jgi:anionic cell wall polymer biosynthesis LytR-Cps2A-Psr (LCP) family protein
MTGFEGFKRMTDAVGGVDVVVTEPSTSAGYSFTPGTMHMDGEMSLAFVRERKQLSGGDVSRGQRQQEFLRALMRKSLAPGTLANPVQAARFIDAATQHLTVDRSLDVDRMRSLAMSLVTVRQGDIHMLTAPFTGFASLPGVGSVELVDMPRMRALGRALRADRLSDYPG